MNQLKNQWFLLVVFLFDADGVVVIITHRGVVVITTGKIPSTKSELMFCAASNPARGVSEICDVENLWQWSQLEIKLNAFRRSTIPKKQFIIIIIVIIIIIIIIIITVIKYVKTTTTNAEDLRQHKSIFSWLSLPVLIWVKRLRICLQISNELHNDVLS